MSRFAACGLGSLVLAGGLGLAVEPPLLSGLLLALAALNLGLLVAGVCAPRLRWFGPVLCAGPRDAGTVYLSFDDGPDPATTPAVLDALARHGARASFFCVGRKLREHPELARRIVAEGHTLGNHSEAHRWSGNFCLRGGWRRALWRAQESARQVCGVTPRWFRPPYGLQNPHLAGALRDLGLRCVGWECGGYDQSRAPAEVVARVLRDLRPGSVVLLHDGGQTPEAAVAVVDGLLAGLQERKLRSVGLDALPAAAPGARPRLVGALGVAVRAALLPLFLLGWPCARLLRRSGPWADRLRWLEARLTGALLLPGRRRVVRAAKPPRGCLLLAEPPAESVEARLLALGALPAVRWTGPGRGRLPLERAAVEAALKRGRRVLLWPEGKLPDWVGTLDAPRQGLAFRNLDRGPWELALFPFEGAPKDFPQACARAWEEPPGAGRERAFGSIPRRSLAAVVCLAFCALGLHIFASRYCVARPPAYEGTRALAAEEPVEDPDGPLRLGRNWRRQRGGVHELGLVGDRWSRGYANARLCRDLLAKQEDVLLALAAEHVPNPLAFWLLRTALTINNSALPDFLSEAEKIHILGLAEGSEDRHPEWGPLYHRVLNYHAAHDISHLLIDNPLVVPRELVGCSAFAAWGPHTADGGLLVGRNFDFEGGEVFDVDKVIFYVWPDDGLPFVHVAWAGMAGAVTGLNRAGLFVSINAGRTDDFRRVGRPTTMVVRQVLEEARTIDEAVALIAAAEVFVSDSFLLASEVEGRAVVVEKSPARWAVREAEDGLLLQTNHYLTDAFAADATNAEHLARATTGSRFGRLETLLGRMGPLDSDSCLAILRDTGVDDVPVGLGNRGSINPLIACHSVIADLRAGRLWVSKGPHTVGSYVAVDVYASLDAGPEEALRRAPSTDEGKLADHAVLAAYPRFLQWKEGLRVARRALEEGDVIKARKVANVLEALNPNAYQNALIAAQIQVLLGQDLRAGAFFTLALRRKPPFARTREAIEAAKSACAERFHARKQE